MVGIHLMLLAAGLFYGLRIVRKYNAKFKQAYSRSYEWEDQFWIPVIVVTVVSILMGMVLAAINYYLGYLGLLILVLVASYSIVKYWDEILEERQNG